MGGSETVTRKRQSDKLQAAYERLAGLMPFGHLQAQTDPVAFLNDIADEIVAMRK